MTDSLLPPSSPVLNALKYLLLVLVGFALASFASGGAVTLAYAVDKHVFGGNAHFNLDFLSVLVISMFIAMFAALPAFLVVLAGEFGNIRSLIYYAVAGALIGGGESFIFYDRPWYPYVGIGFGLVAGAIYWLLAGRVAGQVEGDSRLSPRHKPVLVAGYVVLAVASGATTLFTFYPAILDIFI